MSRETVTLRDGSEWELVCTEPEQVGVVPGKPYPSNLLFRDVAKFVKIKGPRKIMNEEFKKGIKNLFISDSNNPTLGLGGYVRNFQEGQEEGIRPITSKQMAVNIVRDVWEKARKDQELSVSLRGKDMHLTIMRWLSYAIEKLEKEMRDD